jgi:antibiotic biosynthesis monooxygenase (ABM) superfamily enzyme
MDLLSLIVVVAIIGFALWLVTTYVPMPAPVKTTLVVLVVLLIVLSVLRIVVGPVRVP